MGKWSWPDIRYCQVICMEKHRKPCKNIRKCGPSLGRNPNRVKSTSHMRTCLNLLPQKYITNMQFSHTTSFRQKRTTTSRVSKWLLAPYSCYNPFRISIIQHAQLHTNYKQRNLSKPATQFLTVQGILITNPVTYYIGDFNWQSQLHAISRTDNSTHETFTCTQLSVR